MMFTSLSACSSAVSSGWESSVGTGARFFNLEPEGAFFCVARGTLDAAPEITLGELREAAHLGSLRWRTSSSKSLTYTTMEWKGDAFKTCSWRVSGAGFAGLEFETARAPEATNGSKIGRAHV